MNSRIVRIGLAAVAVVAIIAIGLELRPASNSSAQVVSSAAPSPAPSMPLGKLAYGLNGDIYLANWDGSDPVRIADGRPANAHDEPIGYWGPTWSPDGRHLAYREGSDDVIHVSDPEGHPVASVPGYGSYLFSWSPDSTRIAAWLSQGPYRIGIFGLDGVRQTLLSMPRGFRGPDGDPVWSPDGAALLAPTWGVMVPVDGRRPWQLPAGDSRSRGWVWYSPDGTRVATTRDWAVAEGAPLFVGAADGSQARKLVPARVESAVWSPAGDRIAFDHVTRSWRFSSKHTYIQPVTELRVVDVASGTVTTLTDAGAQDRAIRFSPDGERILFSRTRPSGVSSLWSIGADGSSPHRLVAGTYQGDWQPAGRLP